MALVRLTSQVVSKVKSDLDKALKTKVEIVQEKSNEIFEKAIDAMGRLADRPIDLRLDDDTLICINKRQLSKKYQANTKLHVENRIGVDHDKRVMTFNGVGLSQYLRITDIIRPIGNKRTVSTDTAPSLGVNIQEVKNWRKKNIKIKFDIKAKTEVET